MSLIKLHLVAFAHNAVDSKVSDNKLLSSSFPPLEESVVEERCKDPVTDKLRDVRIVNLSGKHDVSELRDRFGEQESLFLIRDIAAVTDAEQYSVIGDYVFVYVGPGTAKGYFPFRVAAVERREFPPLHLLIFLPFAVVADIITSPIQLWFWLQNEDREKSP